MGNATATKRAWTRKDGIELVKGGIDWLVLSAQQRQKVKAWWRKSVRQIGGRSGLYVKQSAFSCHFGFERLLSDVSTAVSAWAVSNTLTPAKTPRLMMRCIVMPSTVLSCVCFFNPKPINTEPNYWSSQLTLCRTATIWHFPLGTSLNNHWPSIIAAFPDSHQDIVVITGFQTGTAHLRYSCLHQSRWNIEQTSGSPFSLAGHRIALIASISKSSIKTCVKQS